MASISVYSNTSNSITLYVTGLQYQYCYNNIYNSDYPRYGAIKLTIGSITQYVSIISHGSIGGNAGYTDWYTFSGLLSNASYNTYATIPWYSETYPTSQVEGSTYGTVYLSSTANTLASSRPAFFYWTYSKSSGSAFNLTANEWNSLASNINAVRSYKGYPTYNFTTAYSGNDFTAAMYNQVVYAIQGIPGYGSYLTTVSSGGTVYASGLNLLVSELNAIP